MLFLENLLLLVASNNLSFSANSSNICTFCVLQKTKLCWFGLRFRAGLRSSNWSSLSVTGVCVLVCEHFVIVRKIRLNVMKKRWPADRVYSPMSTVVWEVTAPQVISLSESCMVLSARLCRYHHLWQDNQPFIFSSSTLPLLTSFEQMSQLCWFCIKHDWLCVFVPWPQC